MSEYYESVYLKRLNRYGLDYQSRVQTQRERDFDNYLYKTIYRIDFEFNGELIPGSLERNKQDYSETQAFLLTRLNVNIPNGTVLMIHSRNETVTPWMVWWLEQIEASGYNRYIVLKMTHFLSWELENGSISQWAYFFGPGASTISDTIKSSTGKPLYGENDNLHMFITTQNSAFSRDLYFEVTQSGVKQGYVVSGLDINSTPGVAYVTVDPVSVREKQEPPEKDTNEEDVNFFWLQGGK